MSELADAKGRFVALARHAASGRTGESDSLRARRAEALAAFADTGFPSTRQEEWRYTDLAPLARTPFELAAPATVDRAAVEALAAPFFACSAFVFVDGRFAPELSTPGGGAGGVRVTGLARVPAFFGALADVKQHPFAALNTALFADGGVDRSAGRARSAPRRSTSSSSRRPAARRAPRSRASRSRRAPEAARS